MRDVIFRPTKEGLIKARKRRLKRWRELNNECYTKEEQLERMRLDVEVFEEMEIVKERTIKYIRCFKNY